MNKSNERLMAILVALRKLPRWALILLTVGVIVVLGVAMFLLIEPKTDTPVNNPTSLAFEVFLKLGVVVLLIIGLAIILRRWQSKSHLDQTKLVSVLETVHLSPHQTLYLINVDGQRLLLGATDQNITNLIQVATTDSKETTNQLSSMDDFSKILAKAKSPTDHLEK